jgi:para-nitrobenzyl esterase
MTDIGTEVRTASGTVRGQRVEGLAVFRGIPFAQPPVGALRFAAPQPPRPWDGVRDAAEFGPAPPQSGPLRAPGASAGTEWLTVNVWSPDPGVARLPVLVWFYGGAYMSGSSSDPLYDAALIARQGLVVVTFNYRVGVEGFAQLGGAPANRGLLDQLAALHWVQHNIARFGGDPDRVTLCGQSAGAGSIATLLTMPLAAGLFRRAIAQTVPGTYCTPALAEDIAAALAARLGAAPTAAGLAATDPQRLADEVDLLSSDMPAHADRWGRAAHVGLPFMPVVDGEMVPDVPWRALKDGRAAGVELLTGHNRDEFRLFLVLAGRLGKITEEDAATALQTLAPAADGEQVYRSAYPHADAETLFELVHSDAMFRMPALHLAQAHTAAGGTAFLYELRWPAPALGGTLGACHGLDVLLLFGTFSSGRLLLGEEEPSAEALTLAGEIRRAWTAFTSHGDPGWPTYRADQRLTRLLDADPSTAPYPEEPSRRIWNGHDLDPFDLL